MLSFYDFAAGSLNVLTKLSPGSRCVQLMRVAGGRGRIRTSVARKERQIYSLLVLATHPPVPQIRSGRAIMSRRKLRDTTPSSRANSQNTTGHLYGEHRNAERARVGRHQP